MTNITGKIYQETNDDGTENRFPKTVVPAVIGLSQYLQDQFNTLSDLYMPKEGESEKLENQEITYRKSEATINAKTVTIDRIYGKTLVWNQLISMSSLSTNSCSKTTNSDRTITATPSGTGTYALFDNAASNYMLNCPNHKYYIASDIKSTGGAVLLGRIYYVGTAPSGKAITITPTTSFARYSFILTGVPAGTVTGVVALSGNIPTDFTIKNFIVVNLTLLYGSEIDGMTDAQILAKFESEFPGYHSYEPGKLISNDAESIEIVGFNQCDENNFEPGAIAGSSGWNTNGFDDKRVRSRDYIRCLSSTNYYASFVRNTYSSYVRIFWYDSEKKFVAQTNNNGISTSPSNAKYMRVQTEGSDYGGTYKNDIVVNISDIDKNGQYEPHYKSELKLNLDSFEVKSQNIWDEDWERGYFYDSNGVLNYSTNTVTLRSKNFIPVKPNTAYYGRTGSGHQFYRVAYFDKNKNYLSFVGNSSNVSTMSFTTPNTCYYIKFFCETYSGDYNNDTCISLSNPGFNGQYEPYGNITISGGLKSAGSAYDEIIRNKYIKRVKRINLGTMNWSFNTGDDGHRCFITVNGVGNMKDVQIPGMICQLYTGGYTGSQVWNASQDKAISNAVGISATHDRIIISDSSYSNADTFKTAMDGVYLDYELANSIEYELAEPLTYTFKAGTTEERISPNSDGLSAPFCCDLTYNASETAGVLDALQGLSRKLELIEERLARLEDDN